MLVLYTKIGCPYAASVLHKIEELGIGIEHKIISDPGIKEELMGLGGDDQSPYLQDTDRNEGMYESEKIMDYLEMHYGKKDIPAG